jgi:hypothetical protein
MEESLCGPGAVEVCSFLGGGGGIASEPEILSSILIVTYTIHVATGVFKDVISLHGWDIFPGQLPLNGSLPALEILRTT